MNITVDFDCLVSQ